MTMHALANRGVIAHRSRFAHLPVVVCLALWSGLADALDVPARLAWAQRVQLSTPVSGVVTRLPAREGLRVAKGELLLELDQRLFRSALRKAQAHLAKTRAVHQEAQRELERTEELFERTLLSEHDRQVAEIAATAALAEYQVAQAELSEAQVHSEYSRLSAPFDAWVVRVEVQPGETVVSRLQARPLVSLVPARQMLAQAWLEADQLGALEEGAPARVILAGTTLPGRVAGVSLEPREAADGVPRYRLDVLFDIPGDVTPRAGRQVRIQLGDAHD